MKRHKKLWLYTVITYTPATQCENVWAKDAAHARSQVAFKAEYSMRVCRGDMPLPKGYRPTGELACDHIEPVPTMRDLVHALTP